MHPADAGHEEAGAERGEVDEPAAEVRLEEDEQHRRYRKRDREQRRPHVLDAPDPVGEEGGDEEDEQELPELRRLEAEERDVDPAPASRGRRCPRSATSTISPIITP